MPACRRSPKPWRTPTAPSGREASWTARLTAAQAQRALDRLVQLQASREPAAHFVRRWRHWLVFGSGWWKDWPVARELPGALPNGSQVSQRDQRLELYYANVAAALRRRLTELEAPPSPPAQN